MTRKTTLKLPDESWKDAFCGNSFRSSFSMTLSQPMIEFLCAVADDVTWDRGLYFQNGGLHRPDNWIASSGALVKRGLIARKSEEEIAKMRRGRNAKTWEEMNEESLWSLTPAGLALVELFKVTGVFVTADAAISKRYRKKA